MTVDDISGDMTIETLVESFPDAGSFFLRWGIRCFACTGVIWGTIEEVLQGKGVTDIDQALRELREHILEKDAE